MWISRLSRKHSWSIWMRGWCGSRRWTNPSSPRWLSTSSQERRTRSSRCRAIRLGRGALAAPAQSDTRDGRRGAGGGARRGRAPPRARDDSSSRSRSRLLTFRSPRIAQSLWSMRVCGASSRHPGRRSYGENAGFARLEDDPSRPGVVPPRCRGSARLSLRPAVLKLLVRDRGPVRQ